MTFISRAEQPVDVAAALAQHKNLALMWHLLYDPDWQVGGESASCCTTWLVCGSKPVPAAALMPWKPGN